jgi:hypothetical protein
MGLVQYDTTVPPVIRGLFAASPNLVVVYEDNTVSENITIKRVE